MNSVYLFIPFHPRMAGLHSLWEIAPTMKISDKMSFVAESDQKDIIIWTNVFAKKVRILFKNLTIWVIFRKFQLEICFSFKEHERKKGVASYIFERMFIHVTYMDGSINGYITIFVTKGTIWRHSWKRKYHDWIFLSIRIIYISKESYIQNCTITLN